jgi:2-polyprenyl-3-methyl-5-hydroxy-6-metoxy-1,4-benzoquinol methylase
MATNERFWDGIARGYAAKPVPNEATYQRKLDITRSYLNPDSHVLEFGCGTGSTAITLASNAKHIRATDVSAEMIKIAIEKATAEGIESVTFEKATLDDEKASGAPYDMVLGHSILHLLENWEEAIRQVHGLLKPGGVFISSSVCLGGVFRVLWPFLTIGAMMGKTPMVRFFTRARLTRAMEEAGFRLEMVWSPGRGPGVFIVAIKP